MGCKTENNVILNVFLFESKSCCVLPHRFVYKRSVSKNSLPRTKGPLLELIQVWLAEAPRNELTKLPERLKEAQLCLISEKLDLVLSEIKQQNPDCTLVV